MVHFQSAGEKTCEPLYTSGSPITQETLSSHCPCVLSLDLNNKSSCGRPRSGPCFLEKKKKKRDLKTNPPTPTPSLNQQPQLQIAHRSPKQFRFSQGAFLFHSHSTLTPQDAQKDIPAALLQFSTAFWKASEIRTNRS